MDLKFDAVFRGVHRVRGNRSAVRFTASKLACLLILGAGVLRGQIEYQINSINPFTDFVRGAVWGTGVNNVWTTNTLAVDEGICLSVLNNNPTSSHTVTITVFNTLDQRATTYLNGPPFRWGQSTLVQNGGGTISGPNFSSIPVTINAQSVTGLYVRTGGAARMSFVFSGSTTAAGSPDTADIFITHNVTGFACGVAVLPASINVQTINQIPTKSQTGGIPIEIQQTAPQTASWTSATPINTTVSINSAGFSGTTITLHAMGGNVTGGMVNFESSDDGAQFYPVTCAFAAGATSSVYVPPSNSFTITSTSGLPVAIFCPTFASSQFRARLNNTLTGAGSLIVNLTSSAIPAQTNSIQAIAPSSSQVLGMAVFNNSGTAITTPVNVKMGSTNLYGWYLFNTTAAVCYLQVFTSAAPTLGTTIPFLNPGIPANGGANLSFTVPINFNPALTVAATTTPTGNVTCAMAVNLFYF
jgi:hypothetical protein